MKRGERPSFAPPSSSSSWPVGQATASFTAPAAAPPPSSRMGIPGRMSAGKNRSLLLSPRVAPWPFPSLFLLLLPSLQVIIAVR
jgi:hypothetical protein